MCRRLCIPPPFKIRKYPTSFFNPIWMYLPNFTSFLTKCLRILKKNYRIFWKFTELHHKLHLIVEMFSRSVLAWVHSDWTIWLDQQTERISMKSLATRRRFFPNYSTFVRTWNSLRSDNPNRKLVLGASPFLMLHGVSLGYERVCVIQYLPTHQPDHVYVAVIISHIVPIYV